MKRNKSKVPKKRSKANKEKLFWWEATVHGVSNKDAVQATLFRLGSTGLLEEPSRLIAYFEPTQYPISSQLTDLLHRATQCRIEVKKIPAQDWESEWKKNFKPRKISKRFVVRPSWEKYKKKKSELVLVIDPKMSFGTGTHETTQLVLQLMERHIKKGNVLDIGTGTGILAIAAAKLGCKKIFAFDVDEHSYENAMENITRNRCGRRIEILQGHVQQLPPAWPKKYDMILANIQKNVILEILDRIRSFLSQDGVLLVSGILTNEDESMRRAFINHGLNLAESKQDGEWVAYVLHHNSMLSFKG